MGSFRVPIGIAALESDRFIEMQALVDTGATYTWVLGDVLEGLGVRPSEHWQFLVADNREVTYPIGWSACPELNQERTRSR
jgi:predicted aspartyl protease